MAMIDRTIIFGTYFLIPAVFYDADGAVIDMTVSGRSARLRLTVSQGTTPTYSYTTASANWTWTSQAGGSGKWILGAETVAGYVAEVFYTDENGKQYRVGGPALYAVAYPDTGAL